MAAGRLEMGQSAQSSGPTREGERFGEAGRESGRREWGQAGATSRTPRTKHHNTTSTNDDNMQLTNDRNTASANDRKRKAQHDI